MSDPTAQEPTMEEILASIRRIISEDDAPAAEPPAAESAASAPHAEPEPAAPIRPTLVEAAPVHEEEDDDDEEDVLELTEPEPAPAETHGDLDVFSALAAEPAPPAPKAAPAPAPAAPAFAPAPAEDEPLLSGGSLDRAASHFGRLSQSIAMPASDQTLEAVVKELLRPLLKDWLDEHLPAIVEERVQAEVERVSRRRV
jgi:cell pole-organizing protein PopZ